MEQAIQGLDFEKLMSLDEEARNAAVAEYMATLEESLKGSIEEQYAGELKSARYENAKYKLTLDKSMPDFSERIEAIETLLSTNEFFSAMSDEEKLRTAYYIDRGKNAPAPRSADALVAELSANPEAMRMVEAAILERIRAQKAPSLSASSGGASIPLTPKAKPKTLTEASALAREAFGI